MMCVGEWSADMCKDRVGREEVDMEGVESQYKPLYASNMEQAPLVGEFLTVVPNLLNGSSLLYEKFREYIQLRFNLDLLGIQC